MNINDLLAINKNDINKIPAIIVPENFFPNMGVLIDPDFDCHNLKVGDLYVGKRNFGWKIGVVYKVNRYGNYIMADMDSPFGMIYSYNTNECYKVANIVNIRRE